MSNHRKAAERHEAAAENHDRAARFWASRRDKERAELQRAMAAYERDGAKLERHWAELTDPRGARSTVRAAELIRGQTHAAARRASGVLLQVAETLERSADLADDHAKRREREGSADEAVQEHEAGKRARWAARRARSQARAWLELVSEGEGKQPK